METTALGSLPREQFRLVKNSSSIIGEEVGKEAGMAAGNCFGAYSSYGGWRRGSLVAITCLRTRNITNGCWKLGGRETGGDPILSITE